MPEESDLGRKWFEEYTQRIDAGVILPGQEGVRYKCPCCGYPTLDERRGYEVCYLCDWEDDGQDDPYAEEVWGGPNHLYSLAEARSNFKRYLTMYDPAKETRRRVLPGPAERNAKLALMKAFEALDKHEPGMADEVASQEVYACEKALARVRGRRLPLP
jgi:hypothetical protein